MAGSPITMCLRLEVVDKEGVLRAQSGLDPEQSFGGVYYIFLRGVKGDEAIAKSGIFIPPASELTVTATERALFLALHEHLGASA